MTELLVMVDAFIYESRPDLICTHQFYNIKNYIHIVSKEKDVNIIGI